MEVVYFLREWDLPQYFVGRVFDGPIRFVDPNSDFQLKILEQPLSRPRFGVTISATIRLTSPDTSQIKAAIDAIQKADHHAIRWEDLSPDNQCLCNRADEKLRKKSRRCLSLWRWKDDAGGSLSLDDEGSSQDGLYWRLTDAGSYCHVPSPRVQTVSMRGGFPRGLDPQSLFSDCFKELWALYEQGEPLAHQMLREARQIAGHSPRAALLIAFSAFEIGIKQHVAAQVPEASWLITNAPTPPVDKIFNKYLAELHKTVPFPEAVQKLRLGKQLQEFTKARNALAHRGVLGQGELVRYLSLTRNALYLLDWLQGCEWAKDRLDNDFREAFCQSA